MFFLKKDDVASWKTRAALDGGVGFAVEEDKRRLKLGVSLLRDKIEMQKNRSRSAVKASNRRAQNAFKVFFKCVIFSFLYYYSYILV